MTEGGENLLEFEQARQQFAAGQTAYFIDTPARLAQIIGLVGDRFKLNTIRVPVDDKENGGLPTGGAAGIILSQDEAVQKAAWEYLKFATGPKGQSIVVETTGYLPTNKLADGADYLAPFTKRNRASKQWHPKSSWRARGRAIRPDRRCASGARNATSLPRLCGAILPRRRPAYAREDGR